MAFSILDGFLYAFVEITSVRHRAFKEAVLFMNWCASKKKAGIRPVR
jgi:hypothetical protein